MTIKEKTGAISALEVPDRIQGYPCLGNGISGNRRHYAGKPVIYNQGGNKLVDENGTPVHYEGHHMLSYDENPGYAGEWKNIQALTPREHMLGVHAAR